MYDARPFGVVFFIVSDLSVTPPEIDYENPFIFFSINHAYMHMDCDHVQGHVFSCRTEYTSEIL